MRNPECRDESSGRGPRQRGEGRDGSEGYPCWRVGFCCGTCCAVSAAWSGQAACSSRTVSPCSSSQCPTWPLLSKSLPGSALCPVVFQKLQRRENSRRDRKQSLRILGPPVALADSAGSCSLFHVREGTTAASASPGVSETLGK